ncbi:MAG: hypothetical protein M3O15_11640, partial [Acidobacteriota bacterium]|nr:hypothetical protein [Acidobacteriota bacterium]
PEIAPTTPTTPTPATPTAPAPAPPAAPTRVVGTVTIVPRNIFDPTAPGENSRLFRFANRLHRTTRPEVIERQLLFRSGDPFSSDVVRESERMLRANSYFYDAQIRQTYADQARVDLEVLTRDVWTLQGGLNFHRAGGTNATTFEVEDGNFLGTGKDVTLAHHADIDRNSDFFRYRDPSLFSTRARLEFHLADNTDGRASLLSVERPFFSLDARWAAGITGLQDDRIDPLYETGRIVSRFRHRRDFLELYYGTSPGFVDGSTDRFRFGFTYDRDLFSLAPRLTPPADLPRDRRLSYPWIAYQYIEDGFVTEHDLDRLQRTEDLNLGRQLKLRLGWSSPTLGGDRSRAVFVASAADGWHPSARQLVLTSTSASGRYGRDGFENSLVNGSLRYYARDFGNQTFYAALEGDFAHRLDRESQLLLGGDTGLRGYPLRFQDGNRRFLLTVEQRYYNDREYLHLVHLGAAAFFDAGRAWFAGASAAAGHALLKDIGIGLRLGSSRSSHGSVVHLDLAHPLNHLAGVRSLQWLVTTSETF